MAQSTNRSYNYTLLKDLRSGDTVNVYGVVKYFKEPTLTRGSDFSMFISIVDKSTEDKLKCLIFARDAASLPQVSAVGDVIRFHRLKIKEFNDQLQGQGQCGRGFSWLVFKHNETNPVSASLSYTCTEADRKRVEELRLWSKQDDVLSQDVSVSPQKRSQVSKLQLQSCHVGQYFDLVCQVIAQYQLDDKCCVLKVWDGTHPPFETKFLDMTERLTLINSCDEFARSAGDYAVDIFVYDDHCHKCAQIKPGDYIRLVNLHAIQYPDKKMGSQCWVVPVELIIHGGGASYKRGIHLLDVDDPDRQILDAQLALLSDSTRHNSQEAGTSGCNPSKRKYGAIFSRVEERFKFNAENKCMLSTATVLDSNHNQKSSSLSDVLQYSVPHKFRLMVITKDYTPKPERPEDLIKLHCTNCHFISSIPRCGQQDESGKMQPVFYKKESGLSLYVCPACNDDVTDRVLSYVIMLQLLLYDDSGWIMAGLWADQAVKFFNGVTPNDVIMKPGSFEYVKKRLQQLTDLSIGQNGNPPYFECCIQSYGSAGGICYQIFDTCLSWSDADP